VDIVVLEASLPSHDARHAYRLVCLRKYHAVHVLAVLQQRDQTVTIVGQRLLHARQIVERG
jgi:hypothetical protein